jgi:alpha-galactosidase
MHKQSTHKRDERDKRIVQAANTVRSAPACTIFPLRSAILLALAMILWVPFAPAADATLNNGNLFATVAARDGSYRIGRNPDSAAILHARVAAQVDHRWLESTDYPQHQVSESSFEDTLGPGHQIAVTSSGLPDRPTLSYTIRTYDDRPFGDIQVAVQNHTGKTLQVQGIRCVEATGEQTINLGGKQSSDRVLSDSFSEDWPPLRIYDLGQAPKGLHRAVGSQLVYNQQSKESVFFGALTSDRFLTILHLTTQSGSAGPTIASFTVDSTGTTEIQATDEESGLREGPPENLIELSLPLVNGETMTSERLMFAAGNDYLRQLENYGAAIRELHHGRVAGDNLLGWWSWTAFYTKITEGNTLTNALWLAEQLKPLGYDYFHFDLGYGYARSEYATPNASAFPHGMSALVHRICKLGLNVGVWTAPFEVGGRSWVYQHHPDWLVQNRAGKPVQITSAEEMPGEPVFVLDATNPGAQQYLRQTYRILAQDWGAKYIKLDFMDNTAIEGNYFRPNTTALEAQRIGLEIIRNVVGENVLLDKDGSPMLNPVGLVDEGRVSQDTGHLFSRSKEAAPGIAARFYMHRNFFINDPDAFTISRQLMEEREIQVPLTLREAEVSIALSAVSGGMYEIGDDLPTLGADPGRLALLKNPDLLQMAKLGRASVPIDLLTYSAEDEQPSVFLLQEDRHQSMLVAFNWTGRPRSHVFSLSQLNLPAGHDYELNDVLEPGNHLVLDRDSIHLEQDSHSVKLIKIVDGSVPALAPSVQVQAPDHARVGEVIDFTGSADSDGVPVLAYHWDFGDGTTEEGRHVTHAYTNPGQRTVRLVADGLDAVPAEKDLSLAVSGTVELSPPTRFPGNE